MDQTDPEFFMMSYSHKEAVGGRDASFSRPKRGWAAGAGPRGGLGRRGRAEGGGPRRRVRAAKAAAGEPEPHKECY
jgi:hypothetical protein